MSKGWSKRASEQARKEEGRVFQDDGRRISLQQWGCSVAGVVRACLSAFVIYVGRAANEGFDSFRRDLHDKRPRARPSGRCKSKEEACYVLHRRPTSGGFRIELCFLTLGESQGLPVFLFIP